ncbi:YggS family pyridoxal phosphate-dependent enzyme [Myxococcus sp. CA051A]|uniref:YggS family pyridoxal phosphate-dependent enzyme n=1 Tax=unclassified Myxococcus TaxID=2648731 RepID=UPI00157A90C3|nr:MULTISPECIES: YggS family pyridoxal phosphate-dependent enzyme [unclassified Myxococcus]NTX13323.1 YggS family pyridoxal phosphate-dependent enzyme [Myxococcus sp. CA056]NTX36225.1 YggS family pyridoxal phosphate-dependent enzyme [Myxococcus sp. CA033]NTX56373.1 YggS family pyridoxal phosphate-dependent enzyme [Myxococcus sp. CA039A]NTX61783.1 YggS family pyridoxal phosphate-dependent enzyme [Myxococcus sp. CA051A]
MGSDVAERLASVRARVTSACARAGRPVESVTLVAVSKLKPAALIREAYAAGQRDFGENYAQELRDKAVELADLEGLRWHAIGPLQTNKVKYVAKVASTFHALERLEVARELSKRREGLAPLPCYVEVNVGGEATKSGLEPSALPDFLAQVRELPGLRLVGLMSLPPPTDDEARARGYFQALHELGQRHALTELSMGTTHDFELAIEAGATLVRVGTAIFGERT